MEEKVYEVWVTGYMIQGGGGKAWKKGEYKATSFQEACEKAFKGDKLYDSERLVHWGCSLHDNEADARKGFG